MMSVSVTSLHKTFIKLQTQNEVLKNINLQVKPGEFITIIGPSGCGKSTLLKLIAQSEIREYEGIITLNHEEITEPSIKQGFIFQEHHLFLGLL